MASLAWAAGLFAASSSSDAGGLLAALPTGSDKVIHAGAYAVLAALLTVALGRRPVAAIAAATLYGLTDELHQALVPGRTPDPLDLLADLAGATLGGLAVAYLRRRRRNRRIQWRRDRPPPSG